MRLEGKKKMHLQVGLLFTDRHLWHIVIYRSLPLTYTYLSVWGRLIGQILTRHKKYNAIDGLIHVQGSTEGPTCDDRSTIGKNWSS